MNRLWSYSATPGIAAEAPPAWPPGTAVRRADATPTLLLFAHPGCPCTRASLGELAAIMSEVRGGVSAQILFHAPSDPTGDVRSSDLWRTAAAIPGVVVIPDEGGAEAARFGAVTSGQVLLYDPGGRLLYAGGITGARGHAGENAGHDRVVGLLRRGIANRASAPVFGCGLAAAEPSSNGGI